MPPKKSKRRFDQDDEEMDKAEKKSKWATLLKKAEKQEDDEEEPNANTLYQQKKQIFNFDFSKQHLLLKQKDPVKKQEPKIVLTQQEQEELDRRLAKQKLEKEEKQKIRKQKQNERKKQQQKEKQQEEIQKQVEQKLEQEMQKKIKSTKNPGDTKKLMYIFLTIMVALALLQYQKEIYVKLSKFRLDSQVNHYEVLQISNGVSDAELKIQYKKLVLKYHPDKNPNCHSCKDKFNQIMNAWEILGNSEKRQHYDKNSGFINQIPSQSLTLTSDNYDHLLGNSNMIWIVEVYDSTSEFCHYFARFWDEAVMNHKQFVNFGRIDVWHQSQMKSYLPYNFQIFPGLYSVHQGELALCQVDFDRPMKSVENCIEARLKSIDVINVENQKLINPTAGKKAVILGGNIRLSSMTKLIHSKYLKYIDFYMIKDNSYTVRVKDSIRAFDLIVEKSKSIYFKYDQFLSGLISQTKTMCQVHHFCKQKPCLLLLQKESIHQQVLPYALIEIVEQKEFKNKIKLIKNLTGMHQKFDIGYYQDGKIQLGYFAQIDSLHSQNGEVIDFPCVEQSIVRTIKQTIFKWLGQTKTQ